MQNYLGDGDTVTIPAPANVTAGQGLRVGLLFGVVVGTVLSGAPMALRVAGEVRLTALTGSGSDAVVGALAYWDNTNSRVTPVASGNLLIGHFIRAKAVGDDFAEVRIDPGFAARAIA